MSSPRELSEQLTAQPVHLVLCLHAPPMFDGVDAVKTVRRFDASVPVVLATQVQNTRINIQAIQSQVTWSIGLPSDVPAGEALSYVVGDAIDWLDEQAE
ncbi:histidine kinase [Haloferax mucosum]|uniref:histidine kinase n=1 Tax=Haloferax mucosum TaxID=403181 RepID=UPI001F4CE495|nr:histidine kinase [Haloferax mucosum]